MKAGAVHDRGAKRDFIDVHAICGTPGWSVGRFIEHAAAKLPLTTDQVRRALTYFVDADKQPMPRGPVPPWEVVKTALTKGVRNGSVDWRGRRDATSTDEPRTAHSTATDHALQRNMISESVPDGDMQRPPHRPPGPPVASYRGDRSAVDALGWFSSNRAPGTLRHRSWTIGTKRIGPRSSWVSCPSCFRHRKSL